MHHSPPGLARLKSRADIVAAVPYLLGHTPSDSLIGIVIDQREVALTVRLDVPGVHEQGAAVTHTATVCAQHGQTAIIVGYGPRRSVEAAARLFTAALHDAGIHVHDVLRVNGGRYFDLRPGAPDTDGVAFDPATSQVAAAAVYAGVAPLPDRAAVQQLFAPVTGAHRTRMIAATDTALEKLTGLLEHGEAADDDPLRLIPARVINAGITALLHAADTVGRGDLLSDDDVAWLTALLIIPEVRGHAWNRADGSERQRQLWIDVTRRAMPAMAAGPAGLLAVTAFLGGDGALANVAVDRALDLDPDHFLTVLLEHAIRAGVPPYLWRDALDRRTDD